MNRIKLLLASTLLVSASMQLNIAAHAEPQLLKNCKGTYILIFIHNQDEIYQDNLSWVRDILLEIDLLKQNERNLPVEIRNKVHPIITNLLVHEIKAATENTSLAAITALKTAYEQAGARAVKLVYPENHTLEFLQELNSHAAAPNSRGFNIHEMEEDVQGVVKFANENSEQIHGALEGATALGDIIQKQSEENAALPPAQQRKWYKRAGACFCTAAQDPKVQEGVVDAAKLALQLAMMFA